MAFLRRLLFSSRSGDSLFNGLGRASFMRDVPLWRTGLAMDLVTDNAQPVARETALEPDAPAPADVSPIVAEQNSPAPAVEPPVRLADSLINHNPAPIAEHSWRSWGQFHTWHDGSTMIASRGGGTATAVGRGEQPPPPDRSGDDDIEGTTGDDDLSGGPGDDAVDGGPGEDKIAGGPGSDELTGGEGQDHFIFTLTSRDGDRAASFTDGADEIADFVPDEDFIDITQSGYIKDIARGILPADRFVLGDEATDDRGQILYFIDDDGNGVLQWDGDGTGDIDPVTLALLIGGPDLTAANILIDGGPLPPGPDALLI